MQKHLPLSATLLLVFLAFSCNLTDYTVVVEFDRVDGLYEEAAVIINGYRVGHVKEMRLEDNRVIAKLSIDKGTKISNKAKFIIKSTDMLGTKDIEIENADSSQTYLADGAKVRGVHETDIISAPPGIDGAVLNSAKPILDSIGYNITPN
jgi:ABC-type transporter Mla subunit MlaD